MTVLNKYNIYEIEEVREDHTPTKHVLLLVQEDLRSIFCVNRWIEDHGVIDVDYTIQQVFTKKEW